MPIRRRSEVFLVPVSQIVAIIAEGEKLTITTMGKGNNEYAIHFGIALLWFGFDPRPEPSSRWQSAPTGTDWLCARCVYLASRGGLAVTSFNSSI
jgi:hypothetical protein